MLLYATCTLNKSYLQPYAGDVRFTPNLERFAREARVFRRHQTESGQSGTAFASLFTGTQADVHGVFGHPTPLADDVELIGEAFRDAGWEVEAWLEHGMASGELGYGQGAVVHERLPSAEDADLRALLDRLAADPSRRALVYTSFTVTHGPYQPAPVPDFCRRYPDECAAFPDPEEFARYVDFYHRAHAFLSYDYPATKKRTAMTAAHEARLVAAIDLLYRANVARLDTLFGGILDAIRARGLDRDAVVVFTADHGETLFREGTLFKWTHGHQLAPEVLGVPLLVRAPGIAPGDWQGVTRSIDVFPTLAGLAGVPLAPREGFGADLAPALRGRVPGPVLRAFSHTSLIAQPVLEASRKWSLFHAYQPRIDPELMWVQVRDGDRVAQLRRAPGEGPIEPRIYDLASDPGELHDLYAPGDPEQRLLRELAEYRQRLVAAYRRHHAAERPQLDLERQRELLEGLGYIE